MSELSIFLFFLIFLLSFSIIKLLHQIFNGFSFFALNSLHKDRESLSGMAAPYSPFFGGPSRMFLVELVVDDG